MAFNRAGSAIPTRRGARAGLRVLFLTPKGLYLSTPLFAHRVPCQEEEEAEEVMLRALTKRKGKGKALA